MVFEEINYAIVGSYNIDLIEKNGAPTRTRTADPLITNQVLYQLSYRGTVWCGGRLASDGAAGKRLYGCRLNFFHL